MTRGAWLNWAALMTWAVVSMPTMLKVASGGLPPGASLAFVAASLLFGIALSACLWAKPGSTFGRVAIPLLALESACGLLMLRISRDPMTAATLVVVAAQLPYFLATAAARWWVVAQAAVVTGILWSIGGGPGASAGIAFGGFQAFAVATSLLAISERTARAELSRTHAELTAAHELLADTSRVAERLRISRDLHDTLGHHLTALSLQLDVASRLTAGQASRHVSEAHAITRLLLSDVRDVVGQLRDSSRIDVTAALRRLIAPAGTMRVHLEAPERLVVNDPAHAHTVVRAVQEVITNAVRHAQAQNLWISIEQRPDGLALRARDDGRGTDTIAAGNGLSGMRERFEEQRGRVEIQAAPGRGFEIRAFIPTVEPSA